MRALVTGGAGFIGSNLVDALVARGDEVAVIDNLTTGRESNLEPALEQGVVLHRADICEAERMQELVGEYAPEVVFHLAAQIDVRRSVADPAFDSRVNVEGTVNMLEAARRVGVTRFVMSSTGGAIYGETGVLPTPEEHPPLPKAPYGLSKFCAERYCEIYTRLYGLPTITLRYGNVYGPRQDPLGEAGVVAIFCGRLEQGRRPTIFGDGTQTRDYVYVADVVESNLAVVEHPEAGGEFNIGTGQETSVLDLVEAMRGLGAQDFEPEFEPARLGEVQRSCLDVSRAREQLGWRAEVGLGEGLGLTLEAARASA
ncbi:MAG TPA: NAD-dependent epimerase/dehydratase family protein [Solirubrobacteraceae bacterium]|nr:NAD-dependent epimerase/dehydratase family protein [Solirubrobacteraceae bacterium]